MLSFNLAALFLCLAGISASPDWEFSYANQGYDFDKATPPDGWVGTNRCGFPNNQSPISLLQPLGSYGFAYGEFVPAEVDNFTVNYQDPIRGSRMSFERKNFFMFVNKFEEGLPTSKISSDLARRVYGFPYQTYYPISFHVHYGTEHAIDGGFYDVAMHTNHYTESPGSKLGDDLDIVTISFSFSVDHYDRSVSAEEAAIIDNFFDQIYALRKESGDVELDEFEKVDQLKFARFMEIFDYGNRWAYLGGVAFPPCNQINFWQVLHTVYPIKLIHRELIKRTFEEKEGELGAKTNNRGIYPINGHQIRFVDGLAVRLRGVMAAVAFAAASVAVI